MARLLDISRVEILPAPTCDMIRFARSIVENEPDAYVLAEAIGAELDWFVTYDKEHFLKERKVSELNFHVGTQGDLIQYEYGDGQCSLPIPGRDQMKYFA